MKRLFNKRTLITGGTTGIGLETAKQFLIEGARVAITGLNPDTLAQAKTDLGSEVLVIQSDAGKVSDQQAMAKQLQEKFGGLDAVFINAGVAQFRPVKYFDEATFDRVMSINLKGPYFLIQALMPLLANPSSIVLNASISAHAGAPDSSVYAASKAGLISLARTLSGELIGRGIRVNAISPGPVATPIYNKMGLSTVQQHMMTIHMVAQIPAARLGNPIEIAKAVVFLASDESSFMVGSELTIDGGMSSI